jgi:8-amino-7-oxononanoate synthase
VQLYTDKIKNPCIQAHGTFVCGKNGGGVAEEFNCEKDVDICIGTLSKAAGCHGGFIACR